MTKGYCVKCRQMVDMQKTEDVTMNNGKLALKGVCSECGKTLYRIKPASKEGMW